MKESLLLAFFTLLLFLSGSRAFTPYIGEETSQVQVAHSRGGSLTQWTSQGDSLAVLRDWASRLNCYSVTFPEGQSPGDSDGGESYRFTFPEGGFSYVITGPKEHWLVTDDGWYSVSNPSDPPASPPSLTLAKLRELAAAKGEALTWEDFSPYPCEPLGSEIYILRYPIDENYSLIISGDLEEPPLSIRLVPEPVWNPYIDVRTESIDDFLNSRIS